MDITKKETQKHLWVIDSAVESYNTFCVYVIERSCVINIIVLNRNVDDSIKEPNLTNFRYNCGHMNPICIMQIIFIKCYYCMVSMIAFRTDRD